MQRRNPGATVALLQKANSQLRGEKIERPEDELNEYISSLTQKTSQQKKSVNFEDLGDSISISSDIEDPVFKPKPKITSGSKFLKKKVPSTETESEQGTSKFLKKPQASASSPAPAASAQARYGQNQSSTGVSGSKPGGLGAKGRPGSSALDKASVLTGKIKQRASTARAFTLDSDSDESLAAAMKNVKYSGEQLSESLATESIKIGRDGGKFLKKATPSPAQSSGPPLTTVTQPGKDRAASALKPSKEETKPKKASPFQLKSSLKYSTDVVLTSEEESLAEFVGGLPSSSGDSMEKPAQVVRRSGRHSSPPGGASRVTRHGRSPSPTPPARSGRETPRGGRKSPSPSNKPPVIRRTPSPSPRANDSRSPSLRRRSPSPKLMRSYSDDSNVAESIMSEVADDYDIGVNIIMDLEDLAPAENELPAISDTPQSESESPFRATARKSEKEDKKSRKKSQKKAEDSERSSKKEHMSPFRASAERDQDRSSRKEDRSPFKAKSDSPFKSSGNRNKSPLKAQENDSPFKAGNKENFSPFKAKTVDDSPFKAKGGDSSFKAGKQESVFKLDKKSSSSPFKSSSAGKRDKSDRESSPFKARDRSSSPSPKKSKTKKQKKSSSKGKQKETSDLFSSFGIQTVEDLLGPSIKESEYESVLSEVDEVKTDVSEDIRTEKPSAYSYSQKFEETTEIPTETEGTKPGPSYTEDFDSISERIGVSSDKGRSGSVSSIRTKYSGDETVADYSTFTETDTETEDSLTRSYDSEDDDERTPRKTYSDTYSTYTEDFSKSLVPTTRSERTPMTPKGKRSAEAQTIQDGLYYAWNPLGSGLAYPTPQYGLEFVDPTPIATHAVSADALEAMTAYSPAMLALQDMLKSQLELTREFLETQRRLYTDFSRNIEPTFHYTTLADAKKYIKKNKKKKLTFKEALQLVDLEMQR